MDPGERITEMTKVLMSMGSVAALFWVLSVAAQGIGHLSTVLQGVGH